MTDRPDIGPTIDSGRETPAAPLAFHPAPPPGTWMNDPNALLFEGGEFCLFAQYRADQPGFRETGWAKFTSPDLLHWSLSSIAFPAAGDQWMYSGSIICADGTFEAFHTLHVAGMERQVRRVADAAGRWSAARDIASLGERARNRRDPYVFRDGSGWAMLLAEPCDWHQWRHQPPSQLRLYRSIDRRNWTEAGVIGPWRPDGIMWEVPLLVRSGELDILIISELDRRTDGAACSVRAWVGKLASGDFEIEPGFPAEGMQIDHGADFYALMGSTEGAWPFDDQIFVAWASSWQTARAMDWPDFCGGPVTFPRTVQVEGQKGCRRVAVRPAAQLLQHFSRPNSGQPVAGLGRISAENGKFSITCRSLRCVIAIDFDMDFGTIEVSRRGVPGDWDHRAAVNFAAGASAEFLILRDGPLVEFFELSSGTGVTLAVGGASESMTIECSIDQTIRHLEWTSL